MRFLPAIFLLASSAAASTYPVALTPQGFEPSVIHVQKGEKVTVLLTRMPNAICGSEVSAPTLGRKISIASGNAVEFTIESLRDRKTRLTCQNGAISLLIHTNQTP